MALINTLRNKMGKVVVAVIAVAILSFVLADLLGPNSTLFGGNNNEIGEIAGETITYPEFQNMVELQETTYAMQTNRQPGEKEKPKLRNQAWELLIAKYAFQKQYNNVGVQVTSDEVWDMMQGENISPGIKQSFTNPETGTFDRDAFMGFLQQLPNAQPQQRYSWEMFKKDLKPARERLKYENLLLKSTFVTSAEGEMDYHAQNDVAEIKYLYVPYHAISDSTINITEGDLATYYKNNKEKYQTENTRSLNYVSFPIVASSQDSSEIKDELLEVKAEFKNIKDDSVYAALNTDGLNYYGTYQAGNLPIQLKSNVSNLTIGDVRGPYLEGGSYKLYKVANIFDDTVSYAKASHILFSGDDEDTKEKAEGVLQELKNGANFSAMAAQHGTDGTASRGGDLGWFKSGSMVEEFNDAVFNESEVGLLDNLVKTEYGYHIIKIDEPKTNTVYKIAAVERNLLPGDETRNKAYQAADLFLSKLDGSRSFEEVALENKLNIVPVTNVKRNDTRLGVLSDARPIVQWLFRDASINEVSDKVFEIDDQNIVAVMIAETKEGTKSLEAAKAQVTAKVRNELKGDKIIEKLNGLNGTLEEKANAYGADANVYTSSDLKLNTNSLPTLGYDPKVVGRAFSLQAGESTEAFASENGVVIIKLENKTTAPEIGDYTTYKTQISKSNQNRVSFNITEAIKENANIIDKRYKFY